MSLRRVSRAARWMAVLLVLVLGLWLWQGRRFVAGARYWWSERTNDQMEIPGLSLTAKSSISEAGSLLLHFSIRNDSGGDVALFVGVDEYEGRPRAYLDVQGAVLHVRKTYLRQPEGVDADYWFIPYVTVLRPGEEYREGIEIPPLAKVANRALYLQMRRLNPFVPVEAKSPVKVGVAVLHVGAYRITPSNVPRKVDHAPPGLLFPWGATHDQQAILEATVTLPEAWTVLDYQ